MVIRPAHAAGDWYPADADELITSIASLLLSQPVTDILPFALIVPHGKYNNFDKISAAAYRHLSKLSTQIDKVIILGGVEDGAKGAVLPICAQFSTPLGTIHVDKNLCSSLSLLPFVNRCDRSHNYSNRIEIQLPFLQTCLLDFNITPILVGDLSLDDLVLLFDSLPKQHDSLIVLSLDIETISQDSLDPIEQKILNAFLTYCQKHNLQLHSVSEEKSDNLDRLLSSYIVH